MTVTEIAPRPITDQLARALNPGDRDLILVPRGVVVEARDKIAALERDVARLRGTLAMTGTSKANDLEVGDRVAVKYRDEDEPNKYGTVVELGRDSDGAFAEVEFTSGIRSDSFDLDDLERVAA